MSVLPASIVCFTLAAAGLFAQLPAPNANGVSAGHHIVIVRDLEGSNKFWTALGAQPAEFGTLKLVKFPGVLLLVRKAENMGGTAGSSVGSLGFKAKDLKAATAQMEAAGFKPLPVSTKAEAMFMEPNGIYVHVREDKSLVTSIASDMVHMVVTDVKAAADWYAKWFGSPIPGANPVFEKGMAPAAPTKGRSFDRIGLEVKGLEEFCKKLETAGIKLDGAYRKAANMNLAVCLLTDPWGTYIELSEGLAAVK